MPPTPKAPSAAELEAPPEEAGLSRQAHFSTYESVEPDADEVPSPGPRVEQTLGKPSEAAPKAFGS
jgi:hypothetical protein